MYHLFVYLHSWLRWVSLVLLVYTSVISWIRYTKMSPFLPSHQKLFKFARVILGIEVLLGLMLYFIFSPATTHFLYHNFSQLLSPSVNFFTIKHPLGMMLAFLILRTGEKKAADSPNKYRTWLIYTLTALLIICLCIPWPFVKYGKPLLRLQW